LELLKKIDSGLKKYTNSVVIALISLILIKTIFQIIVVKSGLKWLSADDYCRTVISYDWLQHPKIYAGVWLGLHFWINAAFIAVIKDLTLAPVFANTVFSILTLIYFYLIIRKIWDKNIAFLSSLLFCVFPFQVWLSTSGMPESIFFFFITASFYYFVTWYDDLGKSKAGKDPVVHLIIAVLLLDAANLLRYEGWFFSATIIILTAVLSYRKFKFSKAFYINTAIACVSTLTAIWWIYQNYLDFGDPFYFIKETTRIFKDFNNAGFVQRVVQYPFFVFYVAPVTTFLGLIKIYRVLKNKRNGFKGNFSLLRIFLLYNVIELLLLMLTGIAGSGGTNLISRYIVINSILLFPFAVWQLVDFRKYLLWGGFTALLLVNIIWSFYYQQAYREDTYEVADLTKKLIDKGYFEPEDKIYFEMTEGYFDIYPLQVVSNTPGRFIMDTIPATFPVNMPSKKLSQKKRIEEQQKLNILELRKFLEQKKIKLFIARSDLLIDKLHKLSYKSEQIGDYHIFYLNENKLKNKRTETNGNVQVSKTTGTTIPPNTISFDKKLIVKEFRIDNSHFGVNPQTITLRWQIADMSILDNLATDEDEYGNYRVKIELASVNNDSAVYDESTKIFSERNVEEFFETEEIKNIITIKPFALLNYSKKFRLSPFESGMYDLRLIVIDENYKEELGVFTGDSVYIYIPEPETETTKDSTSTEFKLRQTQMKKAKDNFLKKPYYPIGRIVAMFPNLNYNEMAKKYKDVSYVVFQNGLMLPFLQRYQGDNFLNIVFNYF